MFGFLQSPRKTIRSVVDSGYLRGTLIILAVFLLLEAFKKTLTALQIAFFFGWDVPSGPFHLTFELLHSGIVILGAVGLLATFLFLIGRRMGGKASFRAVFIATTWPLLLSIIAETIGATLAIAIAAGLGHLLSKDPQTFLHWSYRCIQWPLVVWQWIVTTLCLAEVEEFSMTKAFLHLMLGIAVTAAAVLLIMHTLSIAAR